MNILFYIDRYPGIGGIENVSSIIIKKLCIAHNVFVISNTQQDGIIYPEFVRLFAMPDNTDERSSQNLSFLLSVIKDYKIEAVIYQDSYGQTDTNLCEAVDKTRVPLYVFEHNSPLFIYNKRDLDPITSVKGLIRRILHPYLLQKEIKRKRNLLNHSRKYVLLSKQFIPELCKLIGADENDERITYINNPILPASGDDKIFKENIILCVSRLAKEKCVDKMINMWSSLAHQLPDWKFLIVGDGPERQKLECIVKDLQVPRVEFIGFAKSTVYYQKAKIFWMTSKFEGWGMTLIEAMQQSCIPIAFETYSSIRDIIDNGRTGYLVDPKSVDKFIDYTMLLANDDTHRTILADLAKKKTEEFSVDRIMAEWNKLLE